MAVLAHQHEAQAEDDFALAVGRDRAAADLVADLDVGHVADLDRHAVLGGDDDALDFVERDVRPTPWTSSIWLLGADVAAADVAVVLLDRLDDLVERQLVAIEPVGIDADLILLLVAAPGVDLGRALDGAQLRLDRPSRGSSAARSRRSPWPVTT